MYDCYIMQEIILLVVMSLFLVERQPPRICNCHLLGGKKVVRYLRWQKMLHLSCILTVSNSTGENTQTKQTEKAYSHSWLQN